MVPHAQLAPYGFLFSSVGGFAVSFGGVVGGVVVLGPVVGGVFVVVGVVGPQPTASKPAKTNNATSFLMITPSFRVSHGEKGLAAAQPVAGDSSIGCAGNRIIPGSTNFLESDFTGRCAGSASGTCMTLFDAGLHCLASIILWYQRQWILHPLSFRSAGINRSVMDHRS